MEKENQQGTNKYLKHSACALSHKKLDQFTLTPLIPIDSGR